jgi:hypothetical protein
MESALLESETAAVEVAADITPARQRLWLRDTCLNVDVYLDPIELEGLTKVRKVRFEAVRDRATAEPALVPGSLAKLEVLQNEFAMVEVGVARSDHGDCLFIRDLVSRAEICLDAEVLRSLTQLSHSQFAPLLDPSQLVLTEDPDPDQV